MSSSHPPCTAAALARHLKREGTALSPCRGGRYERAAAAVGRIALSRAGVVEFLGANIWVEANVKRTVSRREPELADGDRR